MSEEELPHSERRDECFVIVPILPELRAHAPADVAFPFADEHTSVQNTLSPARVRVMFDRHRLTTTSASASFGFDL